MSLEPPRNSGYTGSGHSVAPLFCPNIQHRKGAESTDGPATLAYPAISKISQEKRKKAQARTRKMITPFQGMSRGASGSSGAGFAGPAAFVGFPDGFSRASPPDNEAFFSRAAEGGEAIDSVFGPVSDSDGRVEDVSGVVMFHFRTEEARNSAWGIPRAIRLDGKRVSPAPARRNRRDAFQDRFSPA